MPYLIGEVAPARGLDLDALGGSDIPLYATVTPVDPDNATRFFRVDGDAERVSSILAATASLPVLAGGAKVVDDADYVDGGPARADPVAYGSGAGGYPRARVAVTAGERSRRTRVADLHRTADGRAGRAADPRQSCR